MKSEDKQTNIFFVAALVAVIYIGVSLFAFWVRNPELTQMQVLMRFVDALFWQ